MEARTNTLLAALAERLGSSHVVVHSRLLPAALVVPVASAAERKTLDPNMTPGEVTSLHRLARRMRAKHR